MAETQRAPAADRSAAVIELDETITAENSSTAGNEQVRASDAVYVASAIKRVRRTKSAIATIRETIHEVLTEANPQTVRQVFYALTVRGVIKKAEANTSAPSSAC